MPELSNPEAIFLPPKHFLVSNAQPWPRGVEATEAKQSRLCERLSCNSAKQSSLRPDPPDATFASPRAEFCSPFAADVQTNAAPEHKRANREGFDSFVRYLANRTSAERDGDRTANGCNDFFSTQRSFVVGSGGKLLVSHLLCMETLDDDWDALRQSVPELRCAPPPSSEGGSPSQEAAIYGGCHIRRLPY